MCQLLSPVLHLFTIYLIIRYSLTFFTQNLNLNLLHNFFFRFTLFILYSLD